MVAGSMFRLCLVAIFVQHVSATFWRTQFQHWYPEFEYSLETIRRDNCSIEFELYLHGDKTAPIDYLTGGAKTNLLAQPLVNCMLSYASEFIKSNMASAQVLLGLTPTILATLGPSVEEISVLAVVGRRQLLCLLIVASAPAVYPDRPFEYRDPMRLLREREGHLRHRQFVIRGFRSAIVAFEYVIVGLSVANLAHTTYWLGIRSAPNFAPSIPYLPMLWTWIGIIIHLAGSWALRVRMHYTEKRRLSEKVSEVLKAQYTPLVEQRPLSFEIQDESYLSVFLSWLASLCVICHIIFGTLCWSSLLFISVRDSLTVIARYMGSAMASRSVLMYELAILRDYRNGEARNSVSGFELVRSNSDPTRAIYTQHHEHINQTPSKYRSFSMASQK